MMSYINAFWVGGLICAAAQVLIDKTKLTPGRILVAFVVTGVILGGFGIYDKLVGYAGAGATVPIVGFGNVAIKGVSEHGLLGALMGGAEAAAGGISASIVFGFIIALIFSPKSK